ncbi:hypothetical protein [Streptomyces hokutonensis]|uniref:hypothetical protein n=1 Tax=Streptomyces hokutonensis TaxID=1306990 RepID=UPI0038012BAD
MRVPSNLVGLYPVRLRVQSTLIEFGFEFHNDDGSFGGSYRFQNYDPLGLSTPTPEQRLSGVPSNGAELILPASSQSARLVTVTDPPALSESQRVRLFLDGFRVEEWDMIFEDFVGSFALDGIWNTPP